MIEKTHSWIGIQGLGEGLLHFSINMYINLYKPASLSRTDAISNPWQFSTTITLEPDCTFVHVRSCASVSSLKQLKKKQQAQSLTSKSIMQCHWQVAPVRSTNLVVPYIKHRLIFVFLCFIFCNTLLCEFLKHCTLRLYNCKIKWI